MPGQDQPVPDSQDVTDQAVGLLEQIADTALDDDYYVVRAGQPQPSRQFNTLVTAVVFAAFALLVTMAALQTRNDRPATQRERATLISDVNARKVVLASREATAEKLRREVATLQASVDRIDPGVQKLRLQAGELPATGPGAVVTLDPSNLGNYDGRISDNDLQRLVNGLWYAGAEAVSVNGNRVGTLTSIRTAGPAITVNYRSIGPPYVVTAIGDDKTLAERFTANPAGAYLEARRRTAGVRWSVTSSTDLSVPAVPERRLGISHATAIEEDQ